MIDNISSCLIEIVFTYDRMYLSISRQSVAKKVFTFERTKGHYKSQNWPTYFFGPISRLMMYYSSVCKNLQNGSNHFKNPHADIH